VLRWSPYPLIVPPLFFPDCHVFRYSPRCAFLFGRRRHSITAPRMIVLSVPLFTRASFSAPLSPDLTLVRLVTPGPTVPLHLPFSQARQLFRGLLSCSSPFLDFPFQWSLRKEIFLPLPRRLRPPPPTGGISDRGMLPFLLLDAPCCFFPPFPFSTSSALRVLHFPLCSPSCCAGLHAIFYFFFPPFRSTLNTRAPLLTFCVSVAARLFTRFFHFCSYRMTPPGSICLLPLSRQSGALFEEALVFPSFPVRFSAYTPPPGNTG